MEKLAKNMILGHSGGYFNLARFLNALTDLAEFWICCSNNLVLSEYTPMTCTYLVSFTSILGVEVCNITQRPLNDIFGHNSPAVHRSRMRVVLKYAARHGGSIGTSFVSIGSVVRELWRKNCFSTRHLGKIWPCAQSRN